LDAAQYEDELLNLEIDDLSVEDNNVIVFTQKTNFALVLGGIESL
jgi:hypothetical protein